MGSRILTIHHAGKASAVGRLLAGAGYDVDAVADFEDGLARLGDGKYQAIILQAGRDTESWRLCERVRRRDGTPLIVISHNASTDTCVRAITAGADYFLRKPFGPLEFLARVRSLLPRRPAEQRAAIFS